MNPPSLREICAKATKGPWKVREARGDCFVEAKIPGKPYGQEILGDDYWEHLSRPADVALIARLSPETALAVYEALTILLAEVDAGSKRDDFLNGKRIARYALRLLDGRTEP